MLISPVRSLAPVGRYVVAQEQIDQLLERARAAFRDHAWREAFELFSAADAAGGLDAEDLLCLADAAYWNGRLETSLGVMERTYVAYLDRGDDCNAALVALLLQLDHRTRPALSIATGWFRRAERLLKGQPECLATGYLAGARLWVALSRGDLDGALGEAERMVELGSRLGARDLELLGLLRVGQVSVARGDVAGGLEMLDEAVVAAISGELGTTTTAVIYCSAITSCRDLGDYRRAGEWSEAATRWCEREATTGFPGLCRVYHAEILRRRGEWAAAEEEVRRASLELAEFGVLAMAAAGQYELGEMRRLVGDLVGAEGAYRQAAEWGFDPQPGLALLLFERGELDAAADAVGRAVADREPQSGRNEAGWHESRDVLARARLLPAVVEIALARGDLERAREASSQLDAVATDYASDAWLAEASCVRAEVALAEGDPALALDAACRGQLLWAQLGMPYEAARARMAVGAARHAAGDTESARLELEAARAVFRRLGARAAATRAERQLRALGPAPPVGRADGHDLTPREVEVVRLVAEGLTDGEIAERLVLSRHTVHRHLANVRAKLGQPSRAAAVAQATRLGLL